MAHWENVYDQLSESQKGEFELVKIRDDRMKLAHRYMKSELTETLLNTWDSDINKTTGTDAKLEKRYLVGLNQLIQWVKSETPFTIVNGFQSKTYYSLARKNALLFILDDTV